MKDNVIAQMNETVGIEKSLQALKVVTCDLLYKKEKGLVSILYKSMAL